MATNLVQEPGRYISIDVGGALVSGAPIAVGQIAGVATIDADSNHICTIDRRGVWNLSVKGINGSGNSAVAVGDIIYYVSGDTPKLSKKSTGVPFGYALGTVGSSATATIAVAVGV